MNAIPGRKSLILWLALALVLLGASTGALSAHDWPGGHVWDTSIDAKTSNGNTSYATQILSAADDYTIYTDLP